MIHFLHWLLPNKKNRYHPKILQSSGLIAVAAILAIIPSFYNVLSVGSTQVLGYATNISISDLFSLSNNERTAAGLAPYSLNSKLNQAASAKAVNMFEDDYWAHDNPDGTTPWYFIESAEYSYQKAGENLAKGFNTSAGVVNGWMNSPPHKENIVDSDFSDVGYAVMNGVLQGDETTLVVAMYGLAYVEPEPEPTPTPAPTNPTPTPSAPATSTTPQTPAAASEPTPAPTDNTEQTKEPAPKENSEPEPVAVPTRTSTSTVDNSSSSNGAVIGAFSLNPVEIYSGFNWGQKTSLFILSVLLLLFILKHTLVWRAQRGGARGIWMRAHPIGQMSVIVVAMTITIISGAGSVI